MIDDRFKFRVWVKEVGRYCANFSLDTDGVVWSGHGTFKDGVVIEQCTGIKDMNGTLIYEGDVVCYDDTPYSAYASKITGPVVWRKNGFYIRHKESYGVEYTQIAGHDDFWSRKAKIIGNIHDMREEVE